jgi:hypothetical protein
MKITPFMFRNEKNFRYGGGGSVKSPPIPPPVAIPVTTPEAPDLAMKKAMSRSGYARTILAGDLTPYSGKKNLLGGG